MVILTITMMIEITFNLLKLDKFKEVEIIYECYINNHDDEDVNVLQPTTRLNINYWKYKII